MCDFPNVENNDLELVALGEFCEQWRLRISFLDELFGAGHADEALVLCCCYIEAVGGWLSRYETGGREAFAKALLRHDASEVFARLNPVLLLEGYRAGTDPAGRISALDTLSSALACFQEGFHPEEEIVETCRAALPEDEFASLKDFFWTGTVAACAHGMARRAEVHHGRIALAGCGEIILDFPILYPALQRIFDLAKRMIISGKLRIY